MTADRLHELILEPRQMESPTIQELKKLIEKYPFFQTAQLLYIKGLYDTKNYQFDVQLRTASLYAGDRTVLYDLINSSAKPLSIKKEAAVVSEPPLIEESKPAPAQAAADKENLPSASDSPEQILARRLQEISRKGPDASHPDKEADEKAPADISENASPDTDAVFQVVPENGYSQKESSATEESAQPEETHHSFSEWLKLKAEKPAETVRQAESNPAALRKAAENNEPEFSNQKTPAQDIIDKFISSEPRIQPKKAEFYSPVNMARKSVSDNDDIISETLASIYLKQGNLLKAMRMYEKLSLKYPEKSSSFAVQIEKIKKQLNSNS